jgi:hypothetical protein
MDQKWTKFEAKSNEIILVDVAFSENGPKLVSKKSIITAEVLQKCVALGFPAARARKKSEPRAAWESFFWWRAQKGQYFVRGVQKVKKMSATQGESKKKK